MAARRLACMIALAMLAALALFAPPGRAGCIDPTGPATSTVPTVIRVVGFAADGTIDPAGEFSVLLRDLANVPLVGVDVQIDFTNCPGLEICGVSGSPAAAIDPTGRIVSDLTDATGQVHLRIAGSLALPMGNSEPAGWRPQVFGCGTLLAVPPAVVFDLAGQDGANSGDMAYLVTDIGAHQYCSRDDYDGNLTINSADLSVLATRIGTHASMHGCANH